MSDIEFLALIQKVAPEHTIELAPGDGRTLVVDGSGTPVLFPGPVEREGLRMHHGDSVLLFLAQEVAKEVRRHASV